MPSFQQAPSGTLRVEVRSPAVDEVGPIHYGWSAESCRLDAVGDPAAVELPAGSDD